ncbi:hypothetical protein [Actinokineospora cianjurensis]|uniref:Uncharacterized protein n=1 Tax=Actinokineospora cianjurensis TaxID=585224 RepID=A0A421BC35_9PSEU|nr:hypothetical protein [Actinokineospora cianjurensis]RLK61929.1 hypothetical protein CLV68_2474 [Actinokineospora cianjurensis]
MTSATNDHGEQELSKEQHLTLLEESAAEIKGLLDRLEKIRKREAALQAERVEIHTDLKQARELRYKRLTAALDAKIPKSHAATRLGMDRTNLYKLLDGRDDGSSTSTG